MGTIEAGKGLHCLNPGENLVHVHCVQEGLVIPGLELVSTDQKPVRVLLDLVRDLIRGKAVQAGLGDFFAAILVLTRESHNCLVRAFSLSQVLIEGIEVLNSPLDAAGYHHGPCLAADLIPGDHLLMKVIHHDLSL